MWQAIREWWRDLQARGQPPRSLAQPEKSKTEEIDPYSGKPLPPDVEKRRVPGYEEIDRDRPS